MDVRVRALETLLVRKGYVDPAAVDRLIETYEVHVGPHNGARVVARAWADPLFRDALAADATSAIASLTASQIRVLDDTQLGALTTRRLSSAVLSRAFAVVAVAAIAAIGWDLWRKLE
mgnify:CR=1 FL=1